MSQSYRTYDVIYEHTTENSDNVQQNRATITSYGGGELKLKSEIEKQRSGHRDVNILDIRKRQG